MKCEMKIAGRPRGKGRPRFSARLNRAFTPKETREYEKYVKTEFESQVGNTWDFCIDQPLRMTITAYMPIPKSTSKRQMDMMLVDAILPTKKPDNDNIAKSICDALNGIAYKDDRQIVDLSVKKRYAIEPKTIVTLETIYDTEE